MSPDFPGGMLEQLDEPVLPCVRAAQMTEKCCSGVANCACNGKRVVEFPGRAHQCITDLVRKMNATVEVHRDLWLLSHRDTSSVARSKMFALWIS
jgi:hypothetical protein